MNWLSGRALWFSMMFVIGVLFMLATVELRLDGKSFLSFWFDFPFAQLATVYVVMYGSEWLARHCSSSKPLLVAGISCVAMVPLAFVQVVVGFGLMDYPFLGCLLSAITFGAAGVPGAVFAYRSKADRKDLRPKLEAASHVVLSMLFPLLVWVPLKGAAIGWLPLCGAYGVLMAATFERGPDKWNAGFFVLLAVAVWGSVGLQQFTSGGALEGFLWLFDPHIWDPAAWVAGPH